MGGDQAAARDTRCAEAEWPLEDLLDVDLLVVLLPGRARGKLPKAVRPGKGRGFWEFMVCLLTVCIKPGHGSPHVSLRDPTAPASAVTAPWPLRRAWIENKHQFPGQDTSMARLLVCPTRKRNMRLARKCFPVLPHPSSSPPAVKSCSAAQREEGGSQCATVR
eukprot:gene18709-biopygen23441